MLSFSCSRRQHALLLSQPAHIDFIGTLSRLGQKYDLVVVYLDETSACCIAAYGPGGVNDLHLPDRNDERNGA